IEPMEGGGHIEVDANAVDPGDERCLSIVITDNGAGFRQPTIDGEDPNRDDTLTRTGHGFGIEAVRSRLRAAYGDRASLHLQSPWPPHASGGTRVELRLPLKMEA